MTSALVAALPTPIGHHYGGSWQAPLSDETMPVFDPATGAERTCIPLAGAGDVDEAVKAAERALVQWRAIDPIDRARPLRRLADLLSSRMDQLAAMESAATGRPLREMRAQMARIPEWIEYFAGIAPGLEAQSNQLKGGFLSYTAYEPHGVCALLTPWNHPVLILVKKLAAALAAGNTCVIKPSELAPLTPLLLAEWSVEAGLPAGTVNVVTGAGKTGALLCSHPAVQHIDLTGGTETGRRVAAAAAERLVPCTLELGGKTPFLVFEDVDVEEAAAGAAFAAFVASGQTCVSASRFLVAKRLHAAFISALSTRLRQLRVGDPARLETDVGPVISAAAQARCRRYIDLAQAEGARVAAQSEVALEGTPLAGGYFVAPTIFDDVTPTMTLFREEVFGPVVSVTPFDSEDEALRLANDSPYALGASVWTKDVGRAHRVAGAVRGGMVWINDHHKNDPRSIWGGFGDSGYGKENGWDALHSYLRKRNVMVRTTPTFGDWFAGGARYG